MHAHHVQEWTCYRLQKTEKTPPPETLQCVLCPKLIITSSTTTTTIAARLATNNQQIAIRER
jgi:hypothetical protein